MRCRFLKCFGLPVILTACTSSGSSPGETSTEFSCALFEPADPQAIECDATPTVCVPAPPGPDHVVFGHAIWSQSHCKGFINLHDGDRFQGGLHLGFVHGGPGTYDIVEDDGDETRCPPGGAAPEGGPKLAEATLDGQLGIGTLEIETGGRLDARYTKGRVDVVFEDGRRVRVGFIAPFCGPTE